MLRTWLEKHRMAGKAISAIVLFTFFLSYTTDVRAVVDLGGMAPFAEEAAVREIPPLDAETFAIPEFLATVRDAYKGTSNKVVVHIQDAHCNYDAQKGIAGIISYLKNNYGITQINLEGGSGGYDLSIFTRIEEKDIRQKVSDYFVQDGTVNGAEFFAINNPEDATLWGVEDPKLYMENLNAYRDSLTYKDAVNKYIKDLNYILNNLKLKIYPKDLLDFDLKYAQYKAGNFDFKDYLLYLIGEAKQRGITIKAFPNLYLLTQSLEQEEGIDFRKANRERDSLVERLQRELSKQSLKELARKTIEFKAKRLSQYDFYEFLIKKAQVVNIDLDEYPELQKYIVYVSLYHAVDKSVLMQELTSLEDKVKETMFRDDKQKELSTLSKNLTLMQNMFDISFSKEDWRYYRENRNSFDVRNYTSFINKEAPLYKISARPDRNITDLDTYRGKIEKFFEYSFKRDDAFMKNMRFKGQKNGIEAMVIVTGGFHTENLCDLFKKNGISYISIMPNFTNEEGYVSPYFRLLGGKEPTLVQEIRAIMPPASAIQIASMLNGLGADVWGRANVDAFGVAEWVREQIARGREITGIRLSADGENVIFTIKGADPETVKRSLLVNIAQDHTYDAQMDGLPESAFHDANLTDADMARMREALRAAGAADAMIEMFNALQTKPNARGEQLVRFVDGITFNGHPGGRGIRLRNSSEFRNADGSLTPKGMALLLHEFTGGILGDHILSTRVENAFLANDMGRINLALEAGLDIHKNSPLVKKGLPIWGITEKEERMEVDRDAAQITADAVRVVTDAARIALVERSGEEDASKKLERLLNQEAPKDYFYNIWNDIVNNVVFTESRDQLERVIRNVAENRAPGRPLSNYSLGELRGMREDVNVFLEAQRNSFEDFLDFILRLAERAGSGAALEFPGGIDTTGLSRAQIETRFGNARLRAYRYISDRIRDLRQVGSTDEQRFQGEILDDMFSKHLMQRMKEGLRGVSKIIDREDIDEKRPRYNTEISSEITFINAHHPGIINLIKDRTIKQLGSGVPADQTDLAELLNVVYGGFNDAAAKKGVQAKKRITIGGKNFQGLAEFFPDTRIERAIREHVVQYIRNQVLPLIANVSAQNQIRDLLLGHQIVELQRQREAVKVIGEKYFNTVAFSGRPVNEREVMVEVANQDVARGMLNGMSFEFQFEGEDVDDQQREDILARATAQINTRLSDLELQRERIQAEAQFPEIVGRLTRITLQRPLYNLAGNIVRAGAASATSPFDEVRNAFNRITSGGTISVGEVSGFEDSLTAFRSEVDALARQSELIRGLARDLDALSRQPGLTAGQRNMYAERKAKLEGYLHVLYDNFKAQYDQFIGQVNTWRRDIRQFQAHPSFDILGRLEGVLTYDEVIEALGNAEVADRLTRGVEDIDPAYSLMSLGLRMSHLKRFYMKARDFSPEDIGRRRNLLMEDPAADEDIMRIVSGIVRQEVRDSVRFALERQPLERQVRAHEPHLNAAQLQERVNEMLEEILNKRVNERIGELKSEIGLTGLRLYGLLNQAEINELNRAYSVARAVGKATPGLAQRLNLDMANISAWDLMRNEAALKAVLQVYEAWMDVARARGRVRTAAATIAQRFSEGVGVTGDNLRAYQSMMERARQGVKSDIESELPEDTRREWSEEEGVFKPWSDKRLREEIYARTDNLQSSMSRQIQYDRRQGNRRQLQAAETVISLIQDEKENQLNIGNFLNGLPPMLRGFIESSMGERYFNREIALAMLNGILDQAVRRDNVVVDETGKPTNLNVVMNNYFEQLQELVNRGDLPAAMELRTRLLENLNFFNQVWRGYITEAPADMPWLFEFMDRFETFAQESGRRITASLEIAEGLYNAGITPQDWARYRRARQAGALGERIRNERLATRREMARAQGIRTRDIPLESVPAGSLQTINNTILRMNEEILSTSITALSFIGPETDEAVERAYFESMLSRAQGIMNDYAAGNRDIPNLRRAADILDALSNYSNDVLPQLTISPEQAQYLGDLTRDWRNPLRDQVELAVQREVQDAQTPEAVLAAIGVPTAQIGRYSLPGWGSQAQRDAALNDISVRRILDQQRVAELQRRIDNLLGLGFTGILYGRNYTLLGRVPANLNQATIDRNRAFIQDMNRILRANEQLSESPSNLTVGQTNSLRRQAAERVQSDGTARGDRAAMERMLDILDIKEGGPHGPAREAILKSGKSFEVLKNAVSNYERDGIYRLSDLSRKDRGLVVAKLRGDMSSRVTKYIKAHAPKRPAVSLANSIGGNIAEGTAEDIERWINKAEDLDNMRNVEKNNSDIIRDANRTSGEIAGELAVREDGTVTELRERMETALEKALTGLGVSADRAGELARELADKAVSDLQAQSRTGESFIFFETSIEGPEKYHLGYEGGLAADIMRHLRDLESKGVIANALNEYIVHEGLEKNAERMEEEFGIATRDWHHALINITGEMFDRGTFATPGESPLGRQLRAYIDTEAVRRKGIADRTQNVARVTTSVEKKNTVVKAHVMNVPQNAVGEIREADRKLREGNYGHPKQGTHIISTTSNSLSDAARDILQEVGEGVKLIASTARAPEAERVERVEITSYYSGDLGSYKEALTAEAQRRGMDISFTGENGNILTFGGVNVILQADTYEDAEYPDVMARYGQARINANFDIARDNLEKATEVNERTRAENDMRAAKKLTIDHLRTVCGEDFVDRITEGIDPMDPLAFFNRLHATGLRIRPLDFKSIQEYINMMIETSVSL